jgi:hypothetical protein
MSKLTDAIEQNMLGMVQQTAELANPQPALTSEKLVQLIHAQAKSADMWIQQWQKYKDVSGVRNASLAIGKIFGLYNALLALKHGEDDAPEEIIALMKKYLDVWDDLYISRSAASVIATHG